MSSDRVRVLLARKSDPASRAHLHDIVEHAGHKQRQVLGEADAPLRQLLVQRLLADLVLPGAPLGGPVAAQEHLADGGHGGRDGAAELQVELLEGEVGVVAVGLGGLAEAEAKDLHDAVDAVFFGGGAAAGRDAEED